MSSTSPTTDATREIRPQPGPQTAFLSSPADIVVYGGAAGGGKSWAILAEPLRHVSNPNFGGVIFRRTSPQITNEGGLWDESQKVYPLVRASPRVGSLDWKFPSGANIGFRHLQHESNVHDWQGAQVPFIGFDELTHFTEHQFFYMLSRNRSTCGVRPYIRATTNPDATSWVKTFLAPWLDKAFDGHGGPARSGEVRHFARIEGKITWVPPTWRDAEGQPPKSVTFIRASIFDNQILLRQNPEYLTNLKSLPPLERARLLDGNWDIVADGNLFQRSWNRYWTQSPEEARAGLIRLLVDADRHKVIRLADCRVFLTGDLAASEKKAADYTVFAAWAVTRDTDLVLLDLIRGQWGQAESIGQLRGFFARFRAAYVLLESNGLGLPIVQAARRGTVGEDGSHLPGLPIRGIQQNADKVARAGAAIVRLEAGSVYFPADAPWLWPFENELVAFPGKHDDQVDNVSLASEDAFWAGGAPE
ncbi:MAG: phage terminase large subunit, partial [Chloroflexota bacterium]|nr:phage terminase large subunit [Chloroflexota bacterium]